MLVARALEALGTSRGTEVLNDCAVVSVTGWAVAEPQFGQQKAGQVPKRDDEVRHGLIPRAGRHSAACRPEVSWLADLG